MFIFYQHFPGKVKHRIITPTALYQKMLQKAVVLSWASEKARRAVLVALDKFISCLDVHRF